MGNLRIHTDSLDQEWQSVLLPTLNITHILQPDTFEWVSLHIFQPCINHQFVRQRRKHQSLPFTPIQYVILATKIRTHCHLPLTPYRKTLLIRLMKYIQINISETKFAHIIKFYIDKLQSRPTINPALENSFYQKGIKSLFRKVVNHSYPTDPTIIQDLLNCTHTIPEIPDQTIQSRITKIMTRLTQKPTIQNAIKSLLRV